MTEDLLKLDLYALIGATIESSDAEIKKNYRKKALTCHPDKCPNDPKAADQFLQLGKALEILTDTKARALYDSVIRAKELVKVQKEQLDSKRRKLLDDLEAREHAYREAAEDSKHKNSEEQKLKARIERLKAEGSDVRRKAEVELREEIRKQLSVEISSKSNVSGMLKLKWKVEKDDKINGGYNRNNLRRFFSKYGNVTHVVMSERKNGRALVEFENRNCAESAYNYESGLMSNPLKLKKLWDTNNETKPSAFINPQTSQTINDRDFEDLVLFNVRRAEERHRLMQQMKAEDETDK